MSLGATVIHDIRKGLENRNSLYGNSNGLNRTINKILADVSYVWDRRPLAVLIISSFYSITALCILIMNKFYESCQCRNADFCVDCPPGTNSPPAEVPTKWYMKQYKCRYLNRFLILCPNFNNFESQRGGG